MNESKYVVIPDPEVVLTNIFIVGLKRGLVF